VASAREPYRQLLPDLDLSIERHTEAVPHDGSWYLIRAGEQLGRFRSYRAAQAAWRAVIEECGWQPTTTKLDPGEIRRREQSERWSRNRAG
jgi:hypothetical protein